MIQKTCAFIFLLLFSGHIAGGAFARLEVDDLVIQNHKGNLSRHNSNGGFLLERIEGDCYVSSSGGSIKAASISGDLTVVTERGDIEISDVKGRVRAITKGGNIIIRNCHNGIYSETLMGEITIQSASAVEAKNVLGSDIKLLDLSGNAEISVQGNILIVMNDEFLESKLFDLTTGKGDITFYIPENFNADLEIKVPLALNLEEKTLIKSEFLLAAIREEYIDQNRFVKIRTKINKGGKLIQISSNSRNIYLKKRKK